MNLHIRMRMRDDERVAVAKAIRKAREYACAYRRFNPTYHLNLAIKRAGRGYMTRVYHFDKYTGSRCIVMVEWH